MNTSIPSTSSGLTLRANFSWTFVGNSVNALSWFLMTAVLARLGSPEHVGLFALGLATTAPIFMFATLRLRDVQATDTDQQYQFGDYFALRLTTTAIAMVVVAGIVAASGFEREVALVILATGLSKSIEAVSDAFYGLFMQHERLDRSAQSLMLKGPLSLIGLGVGFYLTGSVFWGVVGLAMARFFILIVFDLRNVALSLDPAERLIGNILPKRLPRPNWNARTLGRLLWLTWPLGLVTMLISFNSNIPRYFIGGHLGAYQLGIFAAIAAFQKAAPTLIQALGRSASPRLAKYFTANNARAFRKLMIKLVGFGAVLGGAGVLVALFAGRLILTVFYGEEYAMPGLFGLIMLAAGIDYIATMFLVVMTSARYFRIQLPLQLLTTGAVALACFFLVPTIGLEGAAIALVVGSLVRAVGGLIASWHAQSSLQLRSTPAELPAAMYRL